MKVEIETAYAEYPRDFQPGDEITVTVRGVIAAISRDLVDVTSLGESHPRTTLGDTTIKVVPVSKAMIT